MNVSGYHDAIYKKKKVIEKQAWVVGHIESELVLGHSTQKETLNRKGLWGLELRKEK